MIEHGVWGEAGKSVLKCGFTIGPLGAVWQYVLLACDDSWTQKDGDKAGRLRLLWLGGVDALEGAPRGRGHVR